MFSSLSKSTKPSTEFFCIIFISLCKLPNYARAAKSLRKRISLRPAGQIQGILNRETHFSQTRQVNSNFFMIKKYTSNHCFTFFSQYWIAQITFQNMLIPYANLLKKSKNKHKKKKKKKKTKSDRTCFPKNEHFPGSTPSQAQSADFKQQKNTV